MLLGPRSIAVSLRVVLCIAQFPGGSVGPVRMVGETEACFLCPDDSVPAQLRDALGACTELNPVYRRLVKRALEELQLIEQQIGQLDQEMANLLRPHQDAVERLAEVPGNKELLVRNEYLAAENRILRAKIKGRLQLSDGEKLPWPKSPTGWDARHWPKWRWPQSIAEVGAQATTFPSAKDLASWVGACLGEEESAEVNYSPRSPKGN